MNVGQWVQAAVERLYRNPSLAGLLVPFLVLSWLSRWLEALSTLGMLWRLRSLFLNLVLLQLAREVSTFWDYVFAYLRALVYLYGPTIWPRIISSAMYGLSLVVWLLMVALTIEQTRYPLDRKPPWQESVHLAWVRWPSLAVATSILFLPVSLVGAAYDLSTFLEIALLEDTRGLSVGPITSMLWSFLTLLFVHLTWQAIVWESRGPISGLCRAWQVFWQAPGSWLGVGLTVYVTFLLLNSLIRAIGAPLAVWIYVAQGWGAGIASWTAAAVALGQATVLVAWWVFSWSLFTQGWAAITGEQDTASHTPFSLQ